MSFRSTRTQIHRPIRCLSLALALAYLSSATAAQPDSSAASRPADPFGASRPANGAVIAVDAAEHDCGLVRAGEKVEHRFKVTNTGSAELRITSIRTNSATVMAGEYPNTLAPEASVEIPLTLNTAGIVGPFYKDAVLFSSDPNRPQLKLAFKGLAEPLIKQQPEEVQLGSIYGDKPQTQVITFTNNSDAPLKLVLDPLASIGNWKFDLVEKEPGRKFELTAAFDPKDAQPGYYRHMALLLSNVASRHQIQIPANAIVRRDRVEAEPAVLMLYPPRTIHPAVSVAASRPAPASRRIIRVQNYGDKPVKVTEALADNPAVKITLDEADAGKSYVLGVNLPQGFSPEAGEAITVKTDDAEIPVIRIPVVTTRPAQANRTRAVAPQACGDERSPSQEINPAELMAGKDAPAFSLTTLDGAKVSRQDLAGTVTVLNFFAPNCDFCKQQMPRVEALRRTYESQGVRFLNVSETRGATPFTPDDVVAKLAELGVAGQTAIDDKNVVGRQFSVRSYPIMFVLDRTGKIEAVNMGNLADLESRVMSQLDGLISAGAKQ